MYNPSHECVYQDLFYDDVFDEETPEEREQIRLFAYQRDLLLCFGQDMQDKSTELEAKLEKAKESILNLYSQIREKETVKTIIQEARNFLSTAENDSILFMLLFSFDLLHLTQPFTSSLVIQTESHKEAFINLFDYLSQKQS